MNYSKPEVAVLGEAAIAIQGGVKGPLTESGQHIFAADCELDD